MKKLCKKWKFDFKNYNIFRFYSFQLHIMEDFYSFIYIWKSFQKIFFTLCLCQITWQELVVPGPTWNHFQGASLTRLILTLSVISFLIESHGKYYCLVESREMLLHGWIKENVISRLNHGKCYCTVKLPMEVRPTTLVMADRDMENNDRIVHHWSIS